MADLKEENPVENVENTENENVEVEEETNEEESSSKPKVVDPTLEGLQFFYEKNKKMINYVGGGLALVIGLFVYYKFYWFPDQQKQAANEIFWAQSYFEKDSFNIALKGGIPVRTAEGDKTMAGFEQIADSYGSTPEGNLANYYAGICYLRTGQFEKAIEFLQKYDGNDLMVAPIAIGCIGDANMELNRVDEALKFYLKAADKNSNIFTTPLYLKKAGFAYELQKNYSEALNVYERIKREHGRSQEARDIDKYIAKVKALGNL
jgi:tetratricopeptide (TPR) repeat protein